MCALKAHISKIQKKKRILFAPKRNPKRQKKKKGELKLKFKKRLTRVKKQSRQKHVAAPRLVL